MKKLTLEHAEAVSAAKLNMIRLSDRADTPKFRQHVEKLIERLSEVHWWVLNGIYRPGLQFNEEPEPEEKPEPERPQDNGTAARQG